MECFDRTIDETDVSSNIDGFASGYAVRRHPQEQIANDAASDARADWEAFLGPVGLKWGSCNPFDGNFTALVLPLTRPERLRAIAYVMEFGFRYDTVAEVINDNPETEQNALSDVLELKYPADTNKNATLLLQKAIDQLISIDPLCGRDVQRYYEEGLMATFQREDKTEFATMEEYLEYRMVDTGAGFTSALLRFGLEIVLSEEEERAIADLVRDCYAALGLLNDYYSFDVEYQEFQSGLSPTLTNAVWLYMQWEKVGIEEAKAMERRLVQHHEQEFLRRSMDLIDNHRLSSPKLELYLRAMAYQVSGNAKWSVRCPRYHPELRAAAAKLLHVKENGVRWTTRSY